MRALVLVLLLAGCASNRLPDTPIGNYPIGPVTPTQVQGVTYRCVQGGTDVLVRGAKNPDPQTCKPVERI